MAYIRKTRDVYEVQGMYNDGFGWSVETTEDTYQEAREQIKCYRENCPQYEFRIVKKRERMPRCRRCGNTVTLCDYKSEAGYKYTCPNCDEDLFSFEVC